MAICGTTYPEDNSGKPNFTRSVPKCLVISLMYQEEEQDPSKSTLGLVLTSLYDFLHTECITAFLSLLFLLVYVLFPVQGKVFLALNDRT